MEIRLAKRSDYQQCVNLNKSLFSTGKWPNFLEARIADARMYVAGADGQVVGFITFETNFVGCLYVSLLTVHPDFRRKGVARRLIEKVATHSWNGKLFSSTEEDNEVSRKMHVALGFRMSGYIDNLPQPTREVIYYKELSPNTYGIPLPIPEARKAQLPDEMTC
ncbi:MAG: GNAT family N-acetyltransferase [Candidatus Abyssobacteria bacterium SURF_17]|uniref:GNAT family N-acetyltransferase n=1 Tax=Candidatus Abyssobacteria bacterium SURF_17 TaxID=2093361 RepID=A0A419F851_9BACT|nr:MAG: GNAT family N-acetyltransferase [Candidatus Abyssubacteria bacterium SURF_17]